MWMCSDLQTGSLPLNWLVACLAPLVEKEEVWNRCSRSRRGSMTMADWAPWTQHSLAAALAELLVVGKLVVDTPVWAHQREGY